MKMQITTLTPVHIASGASYDAYCVNKDKVYFANDVMSCVNIAKITNPNTLQKLASRNSSREDLNNSLGINEYTYIKLTPRYIVKNQLREENYSISENVKTLDKLIIPGSTLKGYIRNLIVYNLISTNQEIKNAYIKHIKENKNGLFDATANFLYQHLIITDLIFDCIPCLYTIGRFKNDGSSIINVNAETIDMEKASNVFDIKIKDLPALKPLDIGDRIDNLIYNETLKTLESLKADFKNNFAKINSRFLNYVLKKELDFANQYNENAKTQYRGEYKKNLLSIQNKIDNGAIIMQIGKFTNYLDKEASHGMPENDYNFYFEKIHEKLSPKEHKKYPNIKTANLIKGYMPLGFIELKIC